MDDANLDDMSKDFLRHLLAAYPEWRSLVRAENSDTADTMHVVVKVPCQAGADCPLEIRTEDAEVTIIFDAWHTHFGWPPKLREDWTDPLILIGRILDEKVRSASVWTGDQWRGAELLDPAEEFVMRPRSDITPDRLRIRSWRGTYDRDEAL